MPMWDLKQLKDSVERLYGRSQQIAISPSLDSIDQRRRFASYHFHEAFRLMSEATNTHESDMQMMLLILGADEEASQEFRWASFQAAAHITACIQSMHTVADMLAHTLYYAYGMNLDPDKILGARQIGIGPVARRLPEGDVKNHLSTLIKNDSFAYLSALTNHSKHRSMVNTTYSLDLTGEAALSHGLKFSGFEYEGETYADRWVGPTLKSEYNRQAVLIISIGQALNVALIADA